MFEEKIKIVTTILKVVDFLRLLHGVTLQSNYDFYEVEAILKARVGWKLKGKEREREKLLSALTSIQILPCLSFLFLFLSKMNFVSPLRLVRACLWLIEAWDTCRGY